MPDTVWVVAGYFGLAVLSAVVPWFNAEVVMLSAVPLAASPLQLGLLVGAVTAGPGAGRAARRSAFRPSTWYRWRPGRCACPSAGFWPSARRADCCISVWLRAC